MEDEILKAQRLAQESKKQLEEERLKEQNSFGNKLKSNWKVFLCLAFIIIGIASVLVSKANADNLARRAGDIKNEIIKTEDELKKLNEEEPAKAKDVRKNKYSATTYGEAIAKLQNEKQNPGIENDENHKKISEEMDKLITSNDYKMGNKWYLGENQYEWKFATNYEFSTDKIPVLWLLFDKGNGNLMKYVVATYNGVTNDFTDFVSNDTSAGTTSMGVTGLSREEKEKPGVDMSGVNEIERRLREKQQEDQKNGKQPISEEEVKKYQQIKSEQFEARQNMLNEYLNKNKKEGEGN